MENSAHNHNHNHNHDHIHNHNAEQPKNLRLAFSATMHCLAGCGIGEVAGMVISSWLLLGNVQSVILSVILGFIAGLILGVQPFLRRKYTLKNAVRTVIAGEGISIAVMELFEVITQMMIPGVMQATIIQPLFWTGMIISLAVGFVAAFPVNLIMIRRGVRHH